MENSLVMMPIQSLYLNKLKLSEALDITKFLLRLVEKLNIYFDKDKYVKEVSSIDFLLKFSDYGEFFDYIVKKYIPNINIVRFPNDSLNIIAKKNDIYIGSHIISIESFNFFNKKLWPDLLTLYVNKVSYISKGSIFEFDLKFDMSIINNIYSSYDLEYVIKEFTSDLSLYLTYNQIGCLKLSENDIIVSKEKLGFKLEILV